MGGGVLQVPRSNPTAQMVCTAWREVARRFAQQATRAIQLAFKPAQTDTFAQAKGVTRPMADR